MLREVDLNKNLTKNEYKEMMDKLAPKFAALQREARAKGLPVMVVFEGWGASGKGTMISRLIQPLDPRGFKVFTIQAENEEEHMHPFLWRFWTKTPAKGRMHIFDRSWYRRVITEQMDAPMDQKRLDAAYHQILSFEEQLSADGTLIIKFFLHISADEQEKRLKKLERSSETKWRVTKADWKHFKQYKAYLPMYDHMLEQTDMSWAPWHVIEATDREYAAVKVMTIVAGMIEERLNEENAKESRSHLAERAQEELPGTEETMRTTVLDGVDVSLTMTKEDYKKRLSVLQKELTRLQNEMYLKRIPVVVALEGWDAAGKGGAIKRLTEPLDPRGYEVVPTAAPNDIEKAHHYLWRFWRAMPKDGHMTIFDRTWYGRVMVERIEGFCSQAEWRRAYREINQMEQNLTDHGVIVLKFWLQIDKDEQERRFNERMEDPEKQWKITDEDWRNREKWDAYVKAVDEMILRTSTTYAPWTIVEADSKYYARIKILETVVRALKNRI
ncbi:MAG: phosphate--AMP phosphotransferase [Coprococcus catus]|uniref:Phosphate--AMP phosphotransferase n=1 Tax=Coprococcus intestinihominis TaxID=3133154 RepID=A0ABV1B0Q9_9FIRM|nr:phosphate--AMP phosphotransferase [Coprococcus catus]MDD6342944.1 phosphate--AMP phosphotransferase [Coprococcus catus]MDY5990097.1 phosphate--AMP phosphotransferase [Coprococcus catus]